MFEAMVLVKIYTRRLHKLQKCWSASHFSLCKVPLKHHYRYLSTASNQENCDEVLDRELKKRIFNTVLWEKDPEVSFVKRRRIWAQEKKNQVAKLRNEESESPRPLALKLLDENISTDSSSSANTESVRDYPPTYPYAESIKNRSKLHSVSSVTRTKQDIRTVVSKRLEERKKQMSKWMSDYDFFDEKLDEESSADVLYGSSDPEEPVSKVPCGGCGALLQCQGPSIPGYLPKELFSKRSARDLKTMICQRCHFLKVFNVALDVNVTPEEYPKIISCIQNKRALAVLMIDLLDFPCSIWPQIMDIIGTHRPVIIVGNKVDLIPGDHEGYMDHLKETLLIYVEKMGISKANVKHVSLISAQSGFGVEDLITQIHDLWEYKSDVFLIGCTNVGKSTLFNKLLQSDLCKTKAMNLVQRATTSIWPGTTLNLLKFPVLRPEGWRLNLRRKRLSSQQHNVQMEKNLRKAQFQNHHMFHMPSFLDYVGQTFAKNSKNEPENTSGQLDMFSIGNSDAEKIGINENDIDFARGRWCYDTPGVMHPDQILNILTTEELVKVIPQAPLVPRFFNLKPGRSLFLAGLGRIDLLTTTLDKTARVAVFSSPDLPVSIIQTHEAEDVYKKLLGSELMAVPCGGPQRLADWPGLQVKDEILHVNGLGWKECCADIVLSSAGWVSVSGGEYMEMSFQVWTPFSRGIHLRQPALLPFAINFRGKKIDHTPLFHTGRADGKSVIPLPEKHQ